MPSTRIKIQKSEQKHTKHQILSYELEAEMCTLSVGVGGHVVDLDCNL